MPEPPSHAQSHRALVGDALDVLFDVLRPYVEERMRATYGEAWLNEARGALRGKGPDRWDTSDLLTLIYFKYTPTFRPMGHEGRSWVSILKEIRKRWAHQAELDVAETRRALETTALVLRAVEADAEAARLEPFVLDLMQREIALRREATGEADAGGVRSLLDKGVRSLQTLWADGEAAPLDLRRDLLGAVERACEVHRHHFDFNRLVVHILAERDRTRDLYEAALITTGESFRSAVRRRLADARIVTPSALRIDWKLHRRVTERLREEFEAGPVYVELIKRRAARSATLTVVSGQAQQDSFTIRSTSNVTIGRLAEVVDTRGRVVRHNTIAFSEDPHLGDDLLALHQTVSRAHARIRYHEAEGVFQLYDDQSTCGTSVVREGYSVPIQVHRQPVVLQDGDRIYFGRACVQFHEGRARSR
ncbi:MAG: Swt1 family HEPN domain-containing protein [Bacteroidota bacterium]